MIKRYTDINSFYPKVFADKRRLRRFVELLDAELPPEFRAPEGVLSVAVFDDRDIAKIHADFMNKPDPTDVITFEGDPSDPEEAGEICISADTARSNAAKFSNTFSRELSLYVAHGYLHLAGVDDISEPDAKVMRRAETLALAIHDKHFKKPIFTFND